MFARVNATGYSLVATNPRFWSQRSPKPHCRKSSRSGPLGSLRARCNASVACLLIGEIVVRDEWCFMAAVPSTSCPHYGLAKCEQSSLSVLYPTELSSFEDYSGGRNPPLIQAIRLLRFQRIGPLTLKALERALTLAVWRQCLDHIGPPHWGQVGRRSARE